MTLSRSLRSFVFFVFVLGLSLPVTGQTVSDAELTITASAVKREVSNMTLRSYTRANGQMVEYLAPNGALYLWLGNNEFMIGTWKTCMKEAQVISNKGKQTLSLAAICRSLPNPKGGKQSFDTVWMDFSKTSLLESAQGDIFNLAKLKKAPYKMSKSRSDFAAMQKKIATQ